VWYIVTVVSEEPIFADSGIVYPKYAGNRLLRKLGNDLQRHILADSDPHALLKFGIYDDVSTIDKKCWTCTKMTFSIDYMLKFFPWM
jgi:hypothetical protein